MAAIYRKKYYKNIVSCGHGWTLEIHQRTELPIVAREIGSVLQGLRLYVQGDQADIDTPIVKTSLEMVFVDAPDLDSKKCGDWEEFYTSDATQYKVLLYKNGVLEWSGYITPDSYAEDLQYRGSVTLVARDNLGAMQDFQYDQQESEISGMVSLSQLLTAAKKAISFPMEIVWNYNDARRVPYSVLTKFEPFADEILFNQSALIGRNWWDILETVLYSTGFALRYVGGNTFMLSSLRDIPLYNFELWSDVPVKPVSFLSYGHRELSPAVKTIKDTVSFEIVDNIAESFMPAEAYGEEGEYVRFVQQAGDLNYRNEYAPIHASVGGTSWEHRTQETSLFLNPFKYRWKEGRTSQKYGDLADETAVYIATNVEDLQAERSAAWEIELEAGAYSLEFTAGYPVALYDGLKKIGFADYDTLLNRVKLRLQFTSHDGTEKLEYRSSSNSWITNQVSDANSIYTNNAPFPYAFKFPPLTVTKRGLLRLEIVGINVYIAAGSTGESQGAYVAIKDLKLTEARQEGLLLPNKLTTTTNYDKNNNIRLERSIAYGFTNADVVSPRIIKNGMFVLSDDDWFVNSDEWVFGSYGIPNPLTVLIHQQILAYYAKPNNVLTGELATPNPTFNALYEWQGKKHLLMSGALNILTGRMENAILREFMRYDHLWETWAEVDIIAVDYDHWHEDVTIHTNKDLTLEDIKITNGDGWLYVHNPVRNDDGTYRVRIYYDDNYTGKNREGFVNIDGFILRVTQSTFGDYSNDYNNDYL